MEQTNIAKKEAKKSGLRVGLAELIYSLIIMLVSLAMTVVYMVFYFLTAPDGQPFNEMVADFTAKAIGNGWLYIIPCLLGVLFLFLFFLKEGTHKELFKKNRTMNAGRFGALFCVLYLFSGIGTNIANMIELDLNFLGFSSTAALDALNIRSSASMYLYVCFLGPIIEEIVYRGFLMRPLQKHGKFLAIVVTSVLFGLMHGTLPQIIYATLIGLVLGFVTMEYSIIWSIVLHIFNNFVYCDLLPEALSGSSELVQFLVDRSFLLITGIIGIIWIVRNRNSIFSWIRANIWEQPKLKWVMTSVCMILTVVYHLISTLFSFTLM